MAYIRDKNIVDIPLASNRTPPNPLLGYDGRDPAPPSATTTTSVTQSALTHQVLFYDQRCLVTGAVSNQLRPCHLVNTIRIKDSSQEEKDALKKEVEHILTRQQFGIGEFFLDSLRNCITMEVQWYGDFDKYGSFCITIPAAQIEGIIVRLTESNKDWDRRAESDPQASRDLDMTNELFIVQKCVLLVLRPDIFLPHNRPVSIKADRALRTSPGIVTQSEKSSWVSYHSSPGTIHLMDASGCPLPEFEFKSLRNPKDLPSIFSLLVNANSKLQNVNQSPCLPGLAYYILIVKNAVREIFHVPEQVQNRDPSLVPPLPSSPLGQHQAVSDLGTSTQSREGGDDHQERDCMLDRRDGGAADEDHSSLNIGFEEFGYDSEEDDEDGEGEDMINGLTFPQMRAILQRVSDGSISREERAEAAMLMLGMAGGNRRPQPVSPLLHL